MSTKLIVLDIDRTIHSATAEQITLSTWYRILGDPMVSPSPPMNVCQKMPTVNLLGNKTFPNESFSMRSWWADQVGPKSTDRCSSEKSRWNRGTRHKEERQVKAGQRLEWCINRCRGRSAKDARGSRSQEKSRKNVCLKLPRAAGPGDNLLLDIYPLDLQESKFLLWKSPTVC